MNQLVEQVIFRPTAGAALEIELVGDIAGMIHFAQSSNEKSPISGAVHDGFARSVKVVAGGRYTGPSVGGSLIPAYAKPFLPFTNADE
jgi:hypothetical protein